MADTYGSSAPLIAIVQKSLSCDMVATGRFLCDPVKVNLAATRYIYTSTFRMGNSKDSTRRSRRNITWVNRRESRNGSSILGGRMLLMVLLVVIFFPF